MAKPAIRTINVDDGDLDKVQTGLARSLNQVKGCALLSGVLITGVSLSPTTTKVLHKLGRKPAGWFVVDTTSTAPIVRSPTSPMDDRYISLYCSGGNATVALWVF